MSSAYAELAAYARKTATFESLARLGGWDQETYMPAKAAEARGEQMSAMAELTHQRWTSEEFARLLEAGEADPQVAGDARLSASVRMFRRDFDRRSRVPADLVAEIARHQSASQQVWKKAREASDFEMFRPYLEKMIALMRRKAECYGIPEGGELYDALLEDYEPGARASRIEAIFTPLRERLTGLLREIARGTAPSEAPLEVRVPEQAQHALGLFVLRAIGFDLEAGRLDTTTHPFCEGLAPGDTRLTTRYREQRFSDALYGTMHEGGHGLYEQGLPKDRHFGEPLGEAIGLGMHESQSRMWENFVGRSRAFWEWLLPHANRHFDGALDGFTPLDLYRATNTGKASLIRVEADEATYNMHVMLRFEIERALFRGEIEAADIPGLWNEKMREYLGIEVPDDARGCLQDVHWSFGLLGYFPTYTLGNLHAAQQFEAIRRAHPDLDDQMARGEFGAVLSWTREHIHAKGRQFLSDELCEQITGEPLSADPLMRHLEGKLREVYGI